MNYEGHMNTPLKQYKQTITNFHLVATKHGNEAVYTPKHYLLSLTQVWLQGEARNPPESRKYLVYTLKDYNTSMASRERQESPLLSLSHENSCVYSETL